MCFLSSQPPIGCRLAPGLRHGWKCLREQPRRILGHDVGSWRPHYRFASHAVQNNLTRFLGVRLGYIYPRFRVSFWVRSQLETYFFLFGPELNGPNFLEPKSIFFGGMVIVLFCPGHSVPHLEFQNGGGFGPHLREGRTAPTRVGSLWVYPAPLVSKGCGYKTQVRARPAYIAAN